MYSISIIYMVESRDVRQGARDADTRGVVIHTICIWQAPSKTRTYEYVEKVFRRHSPSVEELWGVGDQPETDIRGANNAGPHSQSALVGTGMWTGEGNSVGDPAAGDVLAAVKSILKKV